MDSSIDAPTANAHDLMVVRAELDQQRRTRTAQLNQLTADAAEAIAIADQVRLQVIRVLEVAADAALAEIDAALLRLESGSYGLCERCRASILVERLEVLPTARLCTRCQHLAGPNPRSGPGHSLSWPVAGPR